MLPVSQFFYNTDVVIGSFVPNTLNNAKEQPSLGCMSLKIVLLLSERENIFGCVQRISAFNECRIILMSCYKEQTIPAVWCHL